VRLGGLSLCECLFFLGHDPFNGKARVRRDVLTTGLAGAALADLLFDERITLDHGTVVLVSRSPTGEPIADRMLSQIMGETERHGVRDWVEHLRSGIFDIVVENLTVRQLLIQTEKRGMFRLSLHYQPTDLRVASAARAALRTTMLGRPEFDLPTVTLALLAWAVGLDDMCEPELNRKQVTEWIGRVRNTLAEPISGLIAGVENTVAATVYGGNRR
jgi:hypothetical protein